MKKIAIFIIIIFLIGNIPVISSKNIDNNETEYWGIMIDVNIGSSDSHLKEFLIDCGWKNDNILDIDSATSIEFKNAITWVSERADENDIVFLCSNSHGGFGVIQLLDKNLYYSDINKWLELLNVECLIYAISACCSGSAIPILGKEGRIIMTACRDNESAFTYFFLTNLFSDGDLTGYYGCYDVPVPNGAFYRKDCDLNNDSWISIIEAFNYSKKWTSIYYNYFNLKGTPELFYGYHDDINLMNVDNLVNLSDYPNRPVLNGPIEAAKDEECNYEISGEDPNDRQLNYYIVFDNEYFEYGIFDSGETISISHIWEKSGDHEVKV
jgi:hypothetical protein